MSTKDDIFGSDEEDDNKINSNNNKRINYSDGEEEENKDEDNNNASNSEQESEDDDKKKRKRERKEKRREERRLRKLEKKRNRERSGSDGSDQEDKRDDNEQEDDDDDDIADYSSNKRDRNIDRDDNYDDGMVEPVEEKEVIRPPINLTHINKDPLPKAKLMRLKVLNILGIQPQPFSTKTYNEDEPIEKRGANVESVIRWRWVVGEGGVEKKESNTRFVRWEDGSAHLFIGNEVLEVKEHELGGDHIYIYSTQDGFIECEGKLDSRLLISPTDITSKIHRRLAESATNKSKKISKIKTIQTNVDPEKDKEAKERAEAEILRARRQKDNQVRNKAEKIGFDSNYLEEDDGYGYGYSNDDGFVDDDYEEEEEAYDDVEEEEDSMDEFIEKSSSKKRDRHRDRDSEDNERTNKLMKIKQNASSSSKSNNSKKYDSFEDEDEEEDDIVTVGVKRKTILE